MGPTQQSQDTRKTNKAKQPTLSSPIEMIAKIEWTKSDTQQNIEQLRNSTMGVTISNESTTADPLPYNGQQPKPLGEGLNVFYWYQIFALDSAVLEAQNSHGGFLTKCIANVSS